MKEKAIAVTPWLDRKWQTCFGGNRWCEEWFWDWCLAEVFPEADSVGGVRFRAYVDRPRGGGGRWIWFWPGPGTCATTKQVVLGRGDQGKLWRSKNIILRGPVWRFIKKHRRLAHFFSDRRPHRLYVVCKTRGEE